MECPAIYHQGDRQYAHISIAQGDVRVEEFFAVDGREGEESGDPGRDGECTLYVAVEGAVAIGRGEQVQAAPAFWIIHHRVAGRQRGGFQHHAALRLAQVGQPGFQQHFSAFRHAGRSSAGRDGRHAKGAAAQVVGLVHAVVGKAVGVGRACGS